MYQKTSATHPTKDCVRHCTAATGMLLRQTRFTDVLRAVDSPHTSYSLRTPATVVVRIPIVYVERKQTQTDRQGSPKGSACAVQSRNGGNALSKPMAFFLVTCLNLWSKPVLPCFSEPFFLRSLSKSELFLLPEIVSGTDPVERSRAHTRIRHGRNMEVAGAWLLVLIVAVLVGVGIGVVFVAAALSAAAPLPYNGRHVRTAHSLCVLIMPREA